MWWPPDVGMGETPIIAGRAWSGRDVFLCHDDAMSSGVVPWRVFPHYLEARRAEIEDAHRAGAAAPAGVPAAGGRGHALQPGGRRQALASGADAGSRRSRRRGRGDERHARGSRRGATLAMPAACALEFMHTYSLVHDDLPAMDDDTLRRGRPTLHVVYGEGIAILAGDGLLTEAFGLLARRAADRRRRWRRASCACIARIAEAAGVVGMVGGQAIDLSHAGTTRFPGAAARARRRRPAGHARAQDRRADPRGRRGRRDHGRRRRPSRSRRIDRYATDLGLVVPDRRRHPRRRRRVARARQDGGKDAAANKPTYPALFGLDRSRALAADGIARAERVAHRRRPRIRPVAPDRAMGRRAVELTDGLRTTGYGLRASDNSRRHSSSARPLW